MLLLKLQMSSYFTVLRRKDRNYLLPVCLVYATESFVAAVNIRLYYIASVRLQVYPVRAAVLRTAVKEVL